MTTPIAGGAVSLAHNAAIDRFCMNLLAGAPSLEGVREEYRNTLKIEREFEAPVRDDEEKL